ncbi:ppiA, partial [Symbiodinium pilosum]
MADVQGSEPPPASAAAAAAAEAAAAAAWPAAQPDPVQEPPEAIQDQQDQVQDQVQDQGSVDTSSARGASVDRCSGAPAQVEAVNSPRTAPTTAPEKPLEVTVDDEPEVFLEMIKFVYLNTCHVDQANVK